MVIRTTNPTWGQESDGWPAQAHQTISLAFRLRVLDRAHPPQIFNLAVESHDHLNDALVWLIQGLVNQGLELPKIHWAET